MVAVSGEKGMIEPGSIAAQIEHMSPDGEEYVMAKSAAEEAERVLIPIPYNGDIGNYLDGASFCD